MEDVRRQQQPRRTNGQMDMFVCMFIYVLEMLEMVNLARN